MLALNGIRLNLGKSYFQYSPEAGRLMRHPPTLTLTALDHRGVFVRKPLAVATTPGDVAATYAGPTEASSWTWSPLPSTPSTARTRALLSIMEPDIYWVGVGSHLEPDLSHGSLKPKG